MAILGNNTAGGSYVSGGSPGRIVVSRFTLAAAGTLNELHGWVAFGTAGNTLRIVIYKADADVFGTVGAGTTSPGTRVAYTNPLTITGSSTDYDLNQTGLSVPLPAGDYFLGIRFNTDGFVKGSSGTYTGIGSGSADPPPDPFGITSTSGSNSVSVWGVVGAAAAPTAGNFLAFA